MRRRVLTTSLLALTIACATVPPRPPAPLPTPELPLRTIGITVRDARTDTMLPEATGILTPDNHPPIPCENQEGGRLICPTRATGRGDLQITAPGYRAVTLHIPLDELQPDLRLQRTYPAPSPLVRDGRRLRRQDGQPFQWRFASAFGLLADLAADREPRAIAFLDWLAEEGFTGARVLGMSWAGLSPDAAVLRLPHLLDLAAARGLYVELVVFAGTRVEFQHSDEVWFLHTARIGRACAAAVNCLIELANENYHASQDGRLTRLTFLKALREQIPRSVLVSYGAGENDEIDNYPGGDYVEIHLGRGRDVWNMVRHKRELELVSAACACFVVDGEPIGAGDVDEPGRRLADPAVFFGLGLLGRIFEVGSTFHFQAGLDGVVPGPVQQAAAVAFIAGARIVPDDVTLEFKNAGWADSPVRTFRFAEQYPEPNAAIRAYSGIGARSLVALIGVTGDPGVEWQGWRPGAVLGSYPGVRAVGLVRE